MFVVPLLRDHLKFTMAYNMGEAQHQLIHDMVLDKSLTNAAIARVAGCSIRSR